MHITDQKLINRTKIEHGAILERVINAAGVPYSAILSGGLEMASAPTAEEAGLRAWWKREGRFVRDDIE